MGIEVQYITLGEAAARLGVPQPTLRGWVDKLEELGIHTLERNNRDERLFDEDDLEIFRFMKEMKDQYGARRATTTDVGYVIAEKFADKLKKKMDLDIKRRPNLTDVDVQNVLQNERFMSILRGFVLEAQGESEKRIAEEVENRVKAQLELIKEELRNEMEDQHAKTQELLERRIKQTDEWLTEIRHKMDERKRQEEENKKKGFFSKLFGR
jgi:DNA-binding transcriptional ArsR family regulator